MKKFLLATGIFLSFSLIASAQEKKAATTVEPTLQPAPLSKQERNKQLLVRKDNTAQKNAVIKARETNTTQATRSIKKTRRVSTKRTVKTY